MEDDWFPGIESMDIQIDRVIVTTSPDDSGFIAYGVAELAPSGLSHEEWEHQTSVSHGVDVDESLVRGDAFRALPVGDLNLPDS